MKHPQFSLRLLPRLARRALACLACLLAGATAQPAAAMEFSYSNLNPFSGETYAAENLLLKGSIGNGDYARLLDFLRRDPERYWKSLGIVIASPGGDVQEALKIARFVKGTYVQVRVGKATGKCVSACFFIVAAATQREISLEHLGIHRPYVYAERGATMSAAEMEAFQKRVFKEARSYLEDLDVPTSLIDTMFQQASTDVHWLSKREVEEQLGRRPPYYEQFLISRCNFSKALERQYFSSSDKAEREAIVGKLIAAERCGKELSLPDARAYLSAELKKTASRPPAHQAPLDREGGR